MNVYKSDIGTVSQRLGGALPSPIKEILRTGDAWIAGGYILSKITGNPIKDYDIFFKNADAHHYAVLELKAAYNNIADIKINEGTTTFKFPDGRPSIQAIGNWYSPNPHSLLDKFDFTISQCALHFNGNSYELTLAASFYEDVATRELVYNPNDESRGSSIMRVVKYAGKGYKISTEELSKVLEALYARAYPTERNP